jgi:hypothetical protein
MGNSIHIDKLLSGHLTALDLLCSTGTIEFVTDVKTVQNSRNGVIYKLTYEDFSFSLLFDSSHIILERCGNVIDYILRVSNPSERIKVKICFEPTKMGLLVGDSILFEAQKKVEKDKVEEFLLSQYKTIEFSPPIYIPNSMSGWARKKDLVPVIEYPDYDNLKNAISNVFTAVDGKILNSNMYLAFWNKRSKTEDGLPKLEIHNHNTLSGLIKDECLMKGLDVNQEPKAGSGNVDFCISGYIRSVGIRNICIEVKNAHAIDLEEGLIEQLPYYMRHKGADFGTYLVLWYKGKFFDKPDYKDYHLMEDRLHLIRNAKGYSKTIRIITLNLSGEELK